MITEAERIFFEAVMDLSEANWSNDIEAAPGIIERINGIELTKQQKDTINDTLRLGTLSNAEQPNGSDAYMLFVGGLNCIADKERRIEIRVVSDALMSNDTAKMRSVLDAILGKGTILADDGSDYAYIALLIHICEVLKDFDAMDLLREKLVV